MNEFNKTNYFNVDNWSFLGCIGSRHTEHTSQIGSVNEINYKSLENKITDIEQKLGARVGVSLYDVETKKESWSYRGDTRFPDEHV